MADDAIRWAEDSFDQWTRQLSSDVQKAIHFYQLDEGAAELNAWFRRAIPPSNPDEVARQSRLLDGALRRVRIDRELTVYRGVGPRDRTRFPDDVMESLARVNGVIEDRGYLSTSLNQSISISDFATANGTIYEIHVTAGAYAGFIGHPRISRPERQYQSEMLFPRGAFLAIRSVEYGKNGVARWITTELL